MDRFNDLFDAYRKRIISENAQEVFTATVEGDALDAEAKAEAWKKSYGLDAEDGITWTSSPNSNSVYWTFKGPFAAVRQLIIDNFGEDAWIDAEADAEAEEEC